jgi:hypothetical protein
MLLLIQLALGITFIGLLILALFDAVKGAFIILSGLVLLAFGFALKGIAFLKKIHQAPAPVAPPVVTRRVPTWKIIPP